MKKLYAYVLLGVIVATATLDALASCRNGSCSRKRRAPRHGLVVRG